MNDTIHTEDHLSSEQLDARVWDKVQLPPSAEAHLALCVACRRQLTSLEQLATDLDLMRQSQPSAAALDRYSALFALARGDAWSAWQGLMAWVQATLRWDSRQQPALAGLRSAGTRSYRIIYSAPTADVELWVVPQAATCLIEGDCILSTHPAASQDGPLVQLHSLNDHTVVLETTATEDGRFQFAQVPAGVYDLWITPDMGQSVVIERLALP